MAIKWPSFVFLFLVLSISAQAQSTFPAASCNESDVASAIASAIAGGSCAVVTIPAGSCTWSSNLTTPASGKIPASCNSGATPGLEVVGAGNTGCPSSCNDSTTIISNGIKWYFTPQAGTFIRFSGVTIKSSGATTYGVVQFQGPSSGTVPQLRVDHIHGNMTASSDTTASYSSIVGVTDHSLFDETPSSEGNSTKLFYPLAGDSGDQSWNNATGLGSSGYMYFENNIFNHGVANDGQEGARFVFRYNTFNDTSVQTHPTGGDGRGRGARAWEIYNNTFNAISGCVVECGNAFFMSSGTGVVWGNTANNVYSGFITMHSMLVDNSTYPQTATPNGWGYCGTNFNGTGSNWSQNSPATNGYRCLDQPGSGVGDLLQGNFPNVCDSTSGQCAKSNYNGSWSNQAVEPVYEWLNAWGGSASAYWYVSGQASTCSPNCPGGSVLQSNRDYYLWTNPASNNGNTGNFTGASGTGSGLLSARPSTCTAAVAYWATDTNTLYQCSPTNKWTAYYTPYTYPHPLDTSSGPQAPAGLVAVVN